MADHEPMTDVACGAPALTAELRDALTLLRDRSDDEEFRTLVDDVLAGRCSLFDASASAAFGKAVFARVAQEFTERSCGPCGGCTGMCEAQGTGRSC